MWPMTFEGRSKVNGTERHVGHVGAHFKALIISKSTARSVFTVTRVTIAKKLLQCAKDLTRETCSKYSVILKLANKTQVLMTFQ